MLDFKIRQRVFTQLDAIVNHRVTVPTLDLEATRDLCLADRETFSKRTNLGSLRVQSFGIGVGASFWHSATVGKHNLVDIDASV